MAIIIAINLPPESGGLQNLKPPKVGPLYSNLLTNKGVLAWNVYSKPFDKQGRFKTNPLLINMGGDLSGRAGAKSLKTKTTTRMVINECRSETLGILLVKKDQLQTKILASRLMCTQCDNFVTGPTIFGIANSGLGSPDQNFESTANFSSK